MQIMIHHNNTMTLLFLTTEKQKKEVVIGRNLRIKTPEDTNRGEIPQKWRPVLTEIGRQLRVNKLLAEIFRPESADKFLHGEQKLL